MVDKYKFPLRSALHSEPGGSLEKKRKKVCRVARLNAMRGEEDRKGRKEVGQENPLARALFARAQVRRDRIERRPEECRAGANVSGETEGQKGKCEGGAAVPESLDATHHASLSGTRCAYSMYELYISMYICRYVARRMRIAYVGGLFARLLGL